MLGLRLNVGNEFTTKLFDAQPCRKGIADSREALLYCACSDTVNQLQAVLVRFAKCWT